MSRLQLPRLEEVPQIAQYLEGTHNYDMDKHTRLIYHPIAGIVYKRRFQIALDVLRKCCPARVQRMVEVGYGAGLLFPTLSSLADEVIGLDVMQTRAVSAIEGMTRRLDHPNVRFVNGSILEIPLAGHSVDALLCLSMLEHLHPGKEMKNAADEIRRVLRPGGVAVLGFPVKNLVTRLLFKILGYNDDEIHPSSHAHILEGHSSFRVESVKRFPALLPMDLGLYAVVALRS